MDVLKEHARMQAEIKADADFSAKWGLSFECASCYQNPNMEDPADMDHWSCKLKKGKRTMTLFFSKGYGHKGKRPRALEVCECLRSDASYAEYDFPEFCAELGYDEDSRRALRTWKTTKTQADKFRALMGEEYQALMDWDGWDD